MGHFSVEITGLPGSLLSGNQHGSNLTSMRVGTGANLTYFGFRAVAGTPLLDGAGGAMAIGASGSEVMRVHGTNVGIGITTPAEKLQVIGNVLVTGAGPAIKMKDDTAGVTWSISPNSANVLTFSNNAGSPLNVNFANSNVGIGTSAPNAKLEVSQATDTAIKITSSSSGSAWLVGSAANGMVIHNTSPAGPTIFTTNGVEKMRLQASGDLGIGATSPIGATNWRFVTLKSGTSGGALSITNSSDVEVLRLCQDGSQVGLFNWSSTLPTTFSTNGAERMRINPNGYVAIGHTGPVAPLDLATTNGRMLLTTEGAANALHAVNAANNAYIPLVVNGNTLDLRTSNVARLTISATGVAGILNSLWVGQNVSAPASSLNVASGIQASNNGTGSPVFQTYNSNATSGNRFVRWFGDNNGNFVVERVNDAYNAASNKATIGDGILYLSNAIYQGDGSNAYLRATNSNGQLYLGSNGNSDFQINWTGFYPVNDNARNLGGGTNRWATIYAVTGSINTSDEREKAFRDGGLTDAELAAAKEISQQIKVFQFNDSLITKGDDARYHFGVGAQTVWGIMANHGLVDPIGIDGKPGKTQYGFLCWDEWDDVTKDTFELQDVIETVEVEAAFTDDDGVEHDAVTEDRTTQQSVKTGEEITTPAGNRYGIRYDELNTFLIAAQEQRLSALEAQAAL